MNSIINLWETNRPLCVLIGVIIIVIPFLIYYLRKARKEHPKGLIAAALSNMGERFGYYIMNAVLVLFICSKFGISDEVSGIMFAVFYFLIYVLALPGGIIADRTQNYKSTIIWGIVVMALGYAILSIPVFSDHGGFSWVLVITMLALILIACGTVCSKATYRPLWVSSTTTLRPRQPRKDLKHWLKPRRNATADSKSFTSSSTSAVSSLPSSPRLSATGGSRPRT